MDRVRRRRGWGRVRRYRRGGGRVRKRRRVGLGGE